VTGNIWAENRAADLRYALRMIRKTPGASGIAVLSLALGIGANTAIFSLVDTVLLKLLPVRSPKELYQCTSGRVDRLQTSWNFPDYVALRDRNRSFAGLAASSFSAMPAGMQVADGEASSASELAYTLQVSGNYFPVLGVNAEIGRLFTSEEDRTPSASPYAVLGYDYWRSRFQGDPAVIGRKIRLNGYPFTIVGVAHRGFRSTDVSVGPNLYVPILMHSELTGVSLQRWNNRHNFWMQIVGRIKPGVSTRQAETDLYAIYRTQEEDDRRTAPDKRFVNAASPVHLLPAARGYSMVRNRLEKPLLVLMAIVGLVLLVACANVANLMLARGAARQREIAVRLAVGASRSRLTGQLLTESLVMACLGGAAGMALSYFGVQVLVQFLPRNSFANATLQVVPDGRLLAFTTAVSLLSGILFGLAPALQSTRPTLITALREDTPGSGASRFGLRNVLVVVQVALSLLLVIGAGLFVRSLDQLRGIETGFRTERTLIVTVDPGYNGYKGQRLRDFYQRLLSAVERLPGVRSASLAKITPLGGSRWNSFVTIEGYTYKASTDGRPVRDKVIDMNAVGPRYFETLGIPILTGREFREEDSPTVSQELPTVPRAGPPPELPGPRVAIVNESLVKKYFGGHGALGMHLCMDENYDPAKAYEIVGVVKDAHYFGLRDAPEPMVYLASWRQSTDFNLLCVRTSGEAAALGGAIRRQVTALDPAVPMLSARSIEQEIDNNILVDRLLTTLSGFFGAMALLLAAVGLYGVISYAVTRRTREIGVRMALGAERGSVIWLVSRYAAALVLAGAAIGVPAALALSRLVKAFLFGITAQDPLTVAGSTLTLLAAAALASFVPTWRATRVDPMVTLRHE
jgi:predicted permease